MSDGPTKQLCEALAAGARELPEVAAVILFGSHATGRARRDSDIDIAILSKHDVAPDDRLGLLRHIVTRLSQHVAADLLHVTLLDERAPVLAFEVLRDGKVIACTDPVALHRFRVRIYQQHADYEHVERLFRARTVRRASNG